MGKLYFLVKAEYMSEYMYAEGRPDKVSITRLVLAEDKVEAIDKFKLWADDKYSPRIFKRTVLVVHETIT